MTGARFQVARALRPRRILRVAGLAVWVILSAFPALAQEPKAGGWLTLRLREDLPQGFAIREEFQLGTDRNGLEPDDPDANYYEHYACGSSRNYSGYCDETITRLIDQQSQELNPGKRLGLVREIQMKLEQAATRPALVWRLDYFTVWPHLKNLVPHHSIYGWGRFQDVWREK